MYLDLSNHQFNKMKYTFQFFALFLLVLFSCNSKINPETYAEYQKKGNEISGLAQSTLLMNVGKAIQQGGPENAVEFCNLNAAPIVEKLNAAHNCTISRISDKNRNPQNNITQASEKQLWEIFQNQQRTDTLLKTKNGLVYYKPIKIALPACLNCHGNPETDINAATLEKLSELYPEDLATGYKLNDFRGLWKIEFTY